MLVVGALAVHGHPAALALRVQRLGHVGHGCDLRLMCRFLVCHGCPTLGTVNEVR
jgi:hypothetical protein